MAPPSMPARVIIASARLVAPSNDQSAALIGSPAKRAPNASEPSTTKTELLGARRRPATASVAERVDPGAIAAKPRPGGATERQHRNRSLDRDLPGRRCEPRY